MAGTRLHFLGTGTAFNADGRGSQAILVEPTGGGRVLVDCGPTVMQGMSRFGVDPAALDEMFLTHLHGDHTAGWPFLLLHLIIAHRRQRPFTIRGPHGTREHLDQLARTCYEDVLEHQRFELHFEEFPIEAAQGLSTHSEMVFDVQPVKHHPTSVGLRLYLADLRVAVSGDTAWCPELEALARGSDVLVLECTTTRPGPAAHVSLDELRRGRQRLETERILLVHLTDAVAEELAGDPIPGVLAAHDGMVFRA